MIDGLDLEIEIAFSRSCREGDRLISGSHKNRREREIRSDRKPLPWSEKEDGICAAVWPLLPLYRVLP